MSDPFQMTEETLTKAESDAGFATTASDFMFVIDCTHTMQWVLDTICDTIEEVVDIFEKDNLRMRYGIVEFRDRMYDKPEDFALKLHQFGDSSFTEDIEMLKKSLLKLKAEGGGPLKESVFDAIKCAIKNADWRDDILKIVVLITDAEPRTPDLEVKSWKECMEILEQEEIDLHLVVTEEHNKKYKKLKFIDSEETRVLLYTLGEGEAHKSQLKENLRGVGYSSGQKIAKRNAAKGFQGVY